MTLQQLANDYAGKLRRAVVADTMDESVNFSSDAISNTSLVVALQEIHDHLRTLRREGISIDSSDRKQILREVSRLLGLDDFDDLPTIDEAFSNNSYIYMVATITNIARQIKKK